MSRKQSKRAAFYCRRREERIWESLTARFGEDTSDSRYDWDDWDDDDYDCTRCGGEGFSQVDDPLWDDCDEYGYGPCNACNGTGLRSHQTVF